MNRERPRKSSRYPKVPPFQKYYPSIGDMNDEAKAFYQHWRDRWARGDAIEVQGNISYLFVYVYHVLTWHEEGSHSRMIAELKRIQRMYGHEEKIQDYLGLWIADTYAVTGQLEKALEEIKRTSWYRGMNTYYTLKKHLKLPLEGEDLLPFTSAELTFYGRANMDRVAGALSRIFRDYEEEKGVSLLEELLTPPPGQKPPSGFPVYRSSPQSHDLDLALCEFDWQPAREIVSPEMVREAENIVRVEDGVPRIGEGWVSEAVLKHIVAQALEPLGYEVRHRVRPEWLGGLELDIYVPDLSLALEYMGEQHYFPVERFGGEEGLRLVKDRDRRKAEICKKRGVALLLFRYDEPLTSEYVFQRLTAETPLELRNIDSEQIEVPLGEMSSYHAARERMSEAREKLMHDSQESPPVYSGRRLRHLKTRALVAENAIKGVIDGDWDRVFRLLEEWDRQRAADHGVIFRKSVIEENIRRDFSEFGYYLNVDPHLLQRAKAIFALSGTVIGENRLWIELLFEDVTSPWLADYLRSHEVLDEKSDSYYLISLARILRESDRPQEIMRLISEPGFLEEVPPFNKAKGLSPSAKRILRLMVYRKTDLCNLANFQSSTNPVVDPPKAIMELSERGLAIPQNEMSLKDLLRGLTVDQLRATFYGDSMPPAGNKPEIVQYISDEYPEDIVRDRVSRHMDDELVMRTWDFSKRLRDLMDAQIEMVRVLESIERARIMNLGGYERSLRSESVSWTGYLRVEGIDLEPETKKR